jgi:hypothetical protein
MPDTKGNQGGYYSKKNPLGPYREAHRQNGSGSKGTDYIEGFSTKANLKEWASYATRNSFSTDKGKPKVEK